MTFPPRWKIRRELFRLRDQMVGGVTGALYDPPRQFLHDRSFGKHLRVTAGTRSFGTRIALFVLYQPAGIAASTQFALGHLASQGWSPLVVSNAPLSAPDRAMLAANAALVVERPNVGYDFGAYRDGLRIVAERGLRPERLILMNDSTWFPLRSSDDTLARMGASGADMIGHIFKTESTEKRGRNHVESHLLMFSGKALNHPAFAAFWRGYVMSDNRATTVLRGEKRLSQTMLSAGLRTEGLMSRERLLALLARLDDAGLRAAIGQIVHHRADTRAYCAGLLARPADNSSWRDAFLGWVSDVLSNSRQHLLSATFIEPAMRLGGLGFVKKADDRRHQLGRTKVLEAVDAGRLAPLQDDVRREMRQMVDSWVAPFDWRHQPGTEE